MCRPARAKSLSVTFFRVVSGYLQVRRNISQGSQNASGVLKRSFLKYILWEIRSTKDILFFKIFCTMKMPIPCTSIRSLSRHMNNLKRKKKKCSSQTITGEDVRRKLFPRYRQGILGFPGPRVVAYPLSNCFWVLANALGPAGTPSLCLSKYLRML